MTQYTQTATPTAQESAMPSNLGRRLKAARPFLISVIAIVGGLVLWQLVSLTTSPLFLPSVSMTWAAALELISDGTLQQ